MLLDDSLQNLRRARVIPNAFRINDRDGAMRANAKTIRFRAKNRRFLIPGQLQLLQPILQKLPRLEPLFLRATFWLRLIGAKEDVPLDFVDPQRFNLLFQVLLQIAHAPNSRRDSEFSAPEATILHVRPDAQFGSG